MTGKRAIVAAVALCCAGAVPAQIVVSAGDGKQLRPGEAAESRTADGVTLIDMRQYPPRPIGTVAMPACMIGPPEAVAVARNGTFALVTCSERLEGGRNVPATDVTVLDLADPSKPHVLQTVAAGPGASGVTVNRAGTLAMVASTDDDAITVFSIKGKVLTPAGRVQLEPKARPTDVVFAPSGRTAMVVAQGQGRLVPLAIAGARVSIAGPPVAIGVQPYGASYSPDGRYVYNTNLGGRLPLPPPGTRRIGTVSALDTATGRTASVTVGITPEHVTLSRDGRFAAVVVANGTGVAISAPGAFGLLQVYRVDGITLTKLDEVHTGEWGQGAVFGDDGKTLLLQIAAAKQIEVYRFDGRKLTRDPAATMQFDTRPGSIAAAGSR